MARSKNELIDEVVRLAEERANKFGFFVPTVYKREAVSKQSVETLRKYVQNLKREGWRGGKTSPASRGRKKGDGNLTRTDDGGYINKHGVHISEAEKKLLESKVNMVNAKRKKMLKEEASIPRTKGGQPTHQTAGQLQTMGTESDFIIARRSKSLQRFTSRQQFDDYMRELDYIKSPLYLEEKVRHYKRSYMRALESAFGDEAKDVIMKVRMMDHETFRRTVIADENLEIGFIYDPQSRTGKLNQIRNSLGMKLKEDEVNYDEEYE